MSAAYSTLILVLAFFTTLGCSETEFNGDSKPTKQKNANNEAMQGGEIDNDERTEAGSSSNVNEDLGQEVVAAIDDESGEGDSELETINDLVVGVQEGRSVEACFSYDRVKMREVVLGGIANHGHQCNFAIFDVYFSDRRVGQINLNNYYGGGVATLPSGLGPFPDFSGPSVKGGQFKGKWVNGKIDIATRCALIGAPCHDDVAFLSVIGEVKTRNGKTKWLKIDQGIIHPNQRYTYDFSQFTLSHVKPTFGPFCELK